MGYSPLVRATTGISRLWRSNDPADTGFYDATTIFPDHVAARITAIAALAALIGRETTGTAVRVHISQAEVAVNQLGTAFVAEAARAQGLTVTDDAAVHGVHPCEGDDEWCVVSVQSDAHRAAVAAALGEAELPSEPADFNAASILRIVTVVCCAASLPCTRPLASSEVVPETKTSGPLFTART